MVNARIHIICGNCGNNKGFEIANELEFDDDFPEIRVPKFKIVCPNCSTIHFQDEIEAQYEVKK